jgi:uncharacterized protein (UPF0332 family)
MKNEFLAKAKENISAAELLFDNELYNASANRAYYAAFHAARAALAAIGVETEAISHPAAQSQFNAELIRRRKIYPSRLKSYLSNLQDERNTADYKRDSVSKKVASRQLKKAKDFVETIVREIEK